MEEKIDKPDAQIGPLKREVPGPAGRSLGPLFPGAQSQIVDWENEMKNHREMLDKELNDKKNELDKNERNKDAWKLLRESVKFLEENEKNWEARRKERIDEEKRKERLSIVRYKQEKLKERIKERKLEKDIAEGIQKLPSEERKKIEEEEKKKERLELAEIKKNLWKLRSKEKNYERKAEKVERLEKITRLEDKLEMIEKITREIKEEERKIEDERRKRQEVIKNEKRKKMEIKLKKENEKKERLEKSKMLGQRWAMAKWVTQFIKENQENWEKERIEKEKTERKNIEEWEKAKRMEKIQILQRKWRKKDKEDDAKEEKLVKESLCDGEKWKVWRPKKKIKCEKEALTTSQASPENPNQVKPNDHLPISSPQVEETSKTWAGGEGGSQKEGDPGGGYVPHTPFLLTHKAPTEEKQEKPKKLVRLLPPRPEDNPKLRKRKLGTEIPTSSPDTTKSPQVLHKQVKKLEGEIPTSSPDIVKSPQVLHKQVKKLEGEIPTPSPPDSAKSPRVSQRQELPNKKIVRLVPPKSDENPKIRKNTNKPRKNNITSSVQITKTNNKKMTDWLQDSTSKEVLSVRVSKDITHNAEILCTPVQGISNEQNILSDNPPDLAKHNQEFSLSNRLEVTQNFQTNPVKPK